MLDNGLNKYFDKHLTSHGSLKLHELGFEITNGIGTFRGLHMFNTPEGSYCLRDVYAAKEYDAEILLGQVYNLCGLESAIYLPAVDKTKTYLVSNNLDNINSLTGFQFFEKMKDETDESFPFLLPSKIDDKQMEIINKYFTKDAVRDYIKKVVLDTASCNTDGNACNYIFEILNGKANKVKSFDNEYSGRMFFEFGPDSEFAVYQNFFLGALPKNRQEIIQEVKTNETSLSFISPQEIAESIGGVDIVATAKDIEQTLPGYYFNDKYVNGMAYSFDKMAEDLVK